MAILMIAASGHVTIPNKIDDYFYDIVVTEKGISLSSEEMSGLVEMVMRLAENNHEIFQR